MGCRGRSPLERRFGDIDFNSGYRGNEDEIGFTAELGHLAQRREMSKERRRARYRIGSYS